MSMRGKMSQQDPNYNGPSTHWTVGRTWNAPTTISDLYSRICEFIRMYGGNVPKPDDPRALDMIGDFLLITGSEMEIKIRQIAEKAE